jgi:hypothetical protein
MADRGMSVEEIVRGELLAGVLAGDDEAFVKEWVDR